MIPTLNELVGLPAITPPVELAVASERRFLKVLRSASLGDAAAQQELVKLRIAHLNWVYAGQRTARAPAQQDRIRPQRIFG